MSSKPSSSGPRLSALPKAPGKERVLPFAYILDDDPEFSKILSFFLEKMGFKAKSFETPEEFLKGLKSKKPAVAFIDLNMEKDGLGFTVIRAVRGVIGAALPLIVISGRKDQQSIQSALEYGAHDYILKPVDRRILASKLNSLLPNEALGDAAIELTKFSHAYPGKLWLDAQMVAVDEWGVEFLTPHWMTRGVVVELTGSWVESVWGESKTVLTTVSQVGHDHASIKQDRGHEGGSLLVDGTSRGEELPPRIRVRLEWEGASDDWLTAVRRWLLKQSQEEKS